MSGYCNEASVETARNMLEAFASVGAKTFDVTITSLHGDKIQFRKGTSLESLLRVLPSQIDQARAGKQNLIVRPHGPAVLIQLDDLDENALSRVRPAAFLSLCTSPGNYQAWVAIREPVDKDFARRLRKGAGADDTASGATRVAGSLNFKEKYAPAFPRVEITHTAPGVFASKEQLIQIGLVSAPEAPSPSLFRVSPVRLANRKWPSYERCLEGAPPNRNKTGTDVSRADFTWCMTAVTWGWTVEETADRLMELSEKARENGEVYAHRTAQNAASAVARRKTAQR
jgi:hypothetical protein